MQTEAYFPAQVKFLKSVQMFVLLHTAQLYLKMLLGMYWQFFIRCLARESVNTERSIGECETKTETRMFKKHEC